MGNFGKLTAYLEEISQGPVVGCACLVYQGEQDERRQRVEKHWRIILFIACIL
mgnify:CR=1 FL=1